MRIIFYVFITLIGAFHLNGQQIEKLFGAHSNGSQQVFSSLNLSNLNYTSLSVLNLGSNSSFGETTYDSFNNRYFVKKGSTIYILNAISATITDSLNNVGLFYNMEFDQVSNTLIGLSVSGGSFVSKTYDLNTKTGNIKTTLIGVDSIVIGESTFDQAHRRYFTLTNLGLTAIDSNGVLNDVLCSSPLLFGMEYNPLSNKISYLQWNLGNFDFISIEANVCNIEFLATYTTLTTAVRGESTFDKQQGIYYNKTNLGIVKILVQSGQMLSVLPIQINFSGIEYNSVSATANIYSQHLKQEISVYPNPSGANFNFSYLENDSYLEIIDIKGRQIFSTNLNGPKFVLDMTNENPGMYFYKILNSKGILQTGKLILNK